MTSQGRFERWSDRAARAVPVWITLFLLAVAVTGYTGSLLGGLPDWAGRLLEITSNFTAVFLGIFIEAAPFLLLGTLASGIVEVFVDRDDLARWMPRGPLRGALAGSLLGMFFPVCECGVVPFARRLMQKGVPVSVGMATLLAAPVMNPIVIASTLAAFGPGIVFWGRLGLTLLIATLTGWIFSLQAGSRNMLRDVPASIDEMPPPVLGPASPPPFNRRIKRVLVVAADEFFEMGRFLILGALLAALMQTVLRQSDLIAIGQGPVLSVFALTALAVLLSICSTVDAFIALAFSGTFTSGAILAFLVYGPMVDVKSALMFTRVFRPQVVAYLVLLPLFMTLIVTILMNVLGAV